MIEQSSLWDATDTAASDAEALAELRRYPRSWRRTHYPSPEGMQPLTPQQALGQTRAHWSANSDHDGLRMAAPGKEWS